MIEIGAAPQEGERPGAEDRRARRDERARMVLSVTMFGVAFTAPMNGVRTLWGSTLCDLLLAAAAVTAAVRFVAGPPKTGMGRAPAVPRPFAIGLGLVVAGGALGTMFAVHPARSLFDLSQFALAGAAPVLVVWGWRPDLAALRRFAWCWLAGAVTSGVVAFASSGDFTGRAAGLSSHPNQLAMISAMGSVLALALALAGDGCVSCRWVATGCAAVLALAVVRSGSRAGLLALLSAGTVCVFLNPPVRAGERRGRFLSPVLAAGVLGAATAVLAERTAILGPHNAVTRVLGDSTTAPSDNARLSLLRAALHRIAEHPFTGSGFENALRAHDIYVQIWAAAGVAGVVGLVVVAATTVRYGLAVPDRSDRRVLAVGLVAGYLGYLAAGSVQNFLWDRYLWLQVSIILWLAAPTTAGDLLAHAGGDPVETAVGLRPGLFRRARPTGGDALQA